MANGNGSKLDSNGVRLAIYLASLVFAAGVIITQARIEAVAQAEKIEEVRRDLKVLTETVNGLMVGWSTMDASLKLRVEQTAKDHDRYDGEIVDLQKRTQQVEWRTGIYRGGARGSGN